MSVEEPKVKLDYQAYCLFPNDGNRHEVIEGRHYINPASTPDHQSVSKYLQHFLFTQIELTGVGRVFNAPIDVQLGEYDIVQPDLVVILKPSKATVTRSRIKGAPNLIMEILSPSTTKSDLTLKRRLYEQSGVSEYWIVDPAQRAVRQLMLRDGTYHTVAGKKQGRSLAILPDIKIPLDTVWSKALD